MDAQQARRVLDCIVGYKISPLLRKLRGRGEASRLVRANRRAAADCGSAQQDISARSRRWNIRTLHAMLDAGQPPAFEAKDEDLAVRTQADAIVAV